jgi:hypothetical protein
VHDHSHDIQSLSVLEEILIRPLAFKVSLLRLLLALKGAGHEHIVELLLTLLNDTILSSFFQLEFDLIDDVILENAWMENSEHFFSH